MDIILTVVIVVATLLVLKLVWYLIVTWLSTIWFNQGKRKGEGDAD